MKSFTLRFYTPFHLENSYIVHFMFVLEICRRGNRRFESNISVVEQE